MFHASFNKPRTELRYTLVITFPDGEIHSFAVGDAAITIGRSPATAIRVPEDGVSRQHCVISPAGGRLIVLDQGSTNGTFVNGAVVRQARLNDGDVIQVGSTRIRVQAKPADELEPIVRPTEPEAGETYSGADEITTQTYEIPVGTSHIVQRLAERLSASEGAVSAAELILDSVMEVLPVDRAFIFTRRLGLQGIVAEVLASKTRRHTDDATGELDIEVPERVLSTLCGDPNLTTATEATSAVRAVLSDRTTGPVLCAPLRQGGEAFGALYLDALTLPEWAQNDEMIGFLSSVGALAALGISRARLQAELSLELRLTHRQRERLSESGSHPTIGNAKSAKDGKGERGLEDVLAEREVDALRKQRKVTAAAALSLLSDVSPKVSDLNETLGLVGRKLKDGSDEATALLTAAADLGRIVHAVHDVATLVELEASTFELNARAIDGGEMLERAVRSLEARAGEVGVSLALGAVDEGLRVNADPQLMARVLNHLIVDALRHTNRGGRIVLSSRQKAATVQIAVADTGPGVPARQAKQFFSFDGAEEASLVRGGSVELYLCRLATEALGGTIKVVGPNGNNRVIIALPAFEKR